MTFAGPYSLINCDEYLNSGYVDVKPGQNHNKNLQCRTEKKPTEKNPTEQKSNQQKPCKNTSKNLPKIRQNYI